MADRYFQCKYCKKLTTLADGDCYKTTSDIVMPGNLSNEVCICTGAGKRLRELTESQNDMEVALNREINE